MPEMFYIGIFPYGGGHYFFKDPNKDTNEVIILRGYQVDSLVQVDRASDSFRVTTDKNAALRVTLEEGTDWINKYQEHEPMAKVHLVRDGQ